MFAGAAFHVRAHARKHLCNRIGKIVATGH